MTPNIRLAIIVAIGLIIAALSHGGIYHMTSAGVDSFAYRLNKFTGSIQVCVGFDCEPVTVRPGGIRLKEDPNSISQHDRKRNATDKGKITNEPTMVTLTRRLDRAERENRRLTGVGKVKVGEG